MRRLILVLAIFSTVGMTSVLASTMPPLGAAWGASGLVLAVLAVAAVLTLEIDFS